MFLVGLVFFISCVSESHKQSIETNKIKVSFIEIREEESLTVNDTKEFHNQKCIEHCGEGYYYDRPGAKRDGEERVCTKYPLKCGYNCTVGWNFRYLVDGTGTYYTCQEAKQMQSDD